MILLKYYFLLLISITVSVGAYATELYRTVDENGNVVFSDKKTHDAETIIVQPNVIDLDIPDMPESSAQKTSKKRGSNNSGTAQQEISGRNTTNGSNLRRRARTETNGATSRPKATPASGSRAGGR
jgi:hypothetical protein